MIFTARGRLLPGRFGTSIRSCRAARRAVGSLIISYVASRVLSRDDVKLTRRASSSFGRAARSGVLLRKTTGRFTVARSHRWVLITVSQHHCTRCDRYFLADTSDIAPPGSRYTCRVIAMAVRLVVEDGLPYRLFDRRCRTETALVKLARLRRKAWRFKSVRHTLKKLWSPNLLV